MKIWQKYKEYLLTGEWHIHTNYTDGSNTIDEYCSRAVELGIPLLAFTEHVRKIIDYNFEKFLEDIDNAKNRYNIIILSGIEAKVLPDGLLDVNKKIIKKVDYPVFAFHSFPNNISLYYNSLKKAIKNRYINTWAHPGLFISKNNKNISFEELNNIFELMKKYNVLFELNKKYNLPPKEWLKLANKNEIPLVNGDDCHNINDLQISNLQ